ncbi:carbohydrate ABC transporter permease [Thermus sp.]|uniref:carbohydrate ABC transporter permease n=1 Tax=Thermus sp. TaxID=275 RepID=UPI0026356BB3|nr:carbohydrate ABC transporter permease [Thermus sp.]MCX7849920.1 carbohydrate ABC transporter permease [Thermus sp.]
MRRLRRLLPTYLLASGYAFLLVLPLLTLLSASLRSEADLYAPGLLPPRVSLEAYAEALTEFPLGRFLLNSLLVSTAVTLGVLLTSLLAAYALTRLRFRGREVLFGLAVALLLVPGEVTFLPLYLLVDRLGWLDSYLALAVPFLASPLGVFLLRQYLKTLPEDYFDAARIDGANHVQILRHVALPLSAPALGALAALTFIGTWNMYLWPLVVTKSREMQTAQIAVNFILNEEVARWNVVAAGAILVLLPTLLAFLLAQRAFVRGIAMGGLKG